jgi:Cu(I)/Ag(I) efflux system membrane fusion protein
MHPEIIKESSGKCDICYMPLVQTESLGYVSDDLSLVEKPLVIPVTAALVTGTRAVVYVKVPNTLKPTYEGREIVLGPRAGDYYLVRGGLSEGELVVVKGAFKIDSSLQIMAKPSMMSPKAAEPMVEKSGLIHKGPAPGVPRISDTFRKQLSNVFGDYFAMQQALADDNVQLAIESVKKASEALKGVDMKLLSGQDHDKWMKFSVELESTLSSAIESKDIKLFREDFYLLSQQLAKIAKHFGSPGDSALYILHCPMAFDNKGAQWLQDNEQTSNPYFGQMMLRCGGVEEVVGVKGIWERGDK